MEEYEVIVYEYERWGLVETWASSNLTDSDPKQYTCTAGQYDYFPDAPLADDYEYCGDWEIELNEDDCDDDGWRYGEDFDYVDCESILSYHKVRQRKWTRPIFTTDDQQELCVEVIQNERLGPAFGWSKDNLTDKDPQPFKCSAGSFPHFPHYEDAPLLEGYKYVGDWEVILTDENEDEEGWLYGIDFDDINNKYTNKYPDVKKVVRRRSWTRECRKLK